jgi:hypothetical protein
MICPIYVTRRDDFNFSLLAIPGSMLSGITIYFVFSRLFISSKITLPVSVVMSILIFGLTAYYSRKSSTRRNITQNRSTLNIFFIFMYIILIIFAFVSKQSPEIYVHWGQITPTDMIRLGAAIILAFFAPGYALITALDVNHKLGSLPTFLVAYLLSILVNGLIGYITGSVGIPTSNVNLLYGVINVIILSFYVSIMVLGKGTSKSIFIQKSIEQNIATIQKSIEQNISEILVFACFFMMVVISSYYLYDGTIMGDQWYHHGRSYLFTSGTFKDLARIDENYPPFEHGLLATFFAISSVPSVNAYVSINFLNIIPVFGFYYFFTRWLPGRRKAALLASTLFMLSSGFGWAYVFNLAMTNDVSSVATAWQILYTGAIKTFDILLPNSFIDVSQPDITTGLIIIALPAGFVLLGLIRENIDNKFKYVALLAAICVLGLLAHDEFFLFIITACIGLLIFNPPTKNSVFAAIISALLFVILVAFSFPGEFYVDRGIDFHLADRLYHVPFFVLFLLFTLAMWLLARALKGRPLSRIKTFINRPKRFVKGRLRLAMYVAIVGIVFYFYTLSFFLWYIQIPTFNIFDNTNSFKIVPLYLYPLRFGVTGILGLCFILSYYYKKFEKEVFIFGIIAIVAFITGTSYDEMRLNRYIMAAMAGLASLMLYNILIKIKKPLINGLLIGGVVTVSSFSILMYLGYTELGRENPTLFNFNVSMPVRFFPSDTDIHMLKFLRNNLNFRNDDNVALPEKETGIFHGLGWKVVGFAGLPQTKMLQSPLTLEESTLSGLYSLLDYSDSRFIVLPKQDINNGSTENIKFVLQNFEKAYEDDNHIVLSVPSLAPPTSRGDVALVANQRDFEPGRSLPEFNSNYYYYYSLSALALSKIRYDIFSNDDYSAFAKKIVILSSDPLDASAYLEFVKNGGTIVILDTGNSFKGGFSNLLCIKQYADARFNGIMSSSGQYLKISGIASNIGAPCHGSVMKSFYMNNGRQVAPLAIEKKYGNGKIIFVNISGYFAAISKSPHQFFSTLAAVPSLIDLKAEKFTKTVSLNAAPFPYFLGSLNMSGPVMINSSSMLIPNFYTKSLSIGKHPFLLDQRDLSSVPIRDIKLYGDYKLLINSTNLFYRPSASSQYNYIRLNLPVGSDMSIKLSNGSRAEFLIGNFNQPVKITGEEIEFKGIKGDPVLLKSPEIEVDGQSSFQKLRSNIPNHTSKPWGDTIIAPLPLQVKGNTIIKLDHVSYDNYIDGYVTYFRWIKVNPDSTNPPVLKYGELLTTPWGTIINSNIILLLIASACVSLFIYWSSPRVKDVL